MWLTEITVKQHLKEMRQEAEMHHMAVALLQAQNPRHWLTRLLVTLRRRRRAEVIEWSTLKPACQDVTTTMRRAS